MCVGAEDQKVDRWISDLVGLFADPVIYHPKWLESPPEKMRQAIIIQRLIENAIAFKEQRAPLGTVAECAWYLSCTSLVGPLPSEGVRIYLYCFSKTCATMQAEVPEDLKAEKLSQYEESLLLHFKQMDLPAAE